MANQEKVVDMSGIRMDPKDSSKFLHLNAKTPSISAEKEVKRKIRIAAMSDIHVGATSREDVIVDSEDFLKKDIERISNEQPPVDVIVICGDLTDNGKLEEAQKFKKQLEACHIPVLCILGNHDHQEKIPTDIAKTIESITLKVKKGKEEINENVRVLDGDTYILEKDGRRIGFTGVKGFGGGFGKNAWGRFGEAAQVAWYDEGSLEIDKLKIGLKKLDDEKVDGKVVLLHYSPIEATVEGDKEQCYPFLGSSRLEEAIDKDEDVKVVFHGHSHFGEREGRTVKGKKVYNVAYFRQKKENPQKPYRIVEV